MPITRIKLNNFTVFESLDFEPSRGLNILVGANGTGKTHLMKVAYGACDVSGTDEPLRQKLIRLFLPSERRAGRLVRRRQGVDTCRIVVADEDRKLSIRFTSRQSDRKFRSGHLAWSSRRISSAYIPVKEMLANAPGFISLYDLREIHFEEVYRDILTQAFVPIERGPIQNQRRKLLKILDSAMGGTVTSQGEEFFLISKDGRLEFTLLAEGLRKLGLLWLLIRNGTLLEGSVLFWDEPETNLNPTLYRAVVEVLLELQRSGVQVFIATHDYAILKEVDLGTRDGDAIAFHALSRDGKDGAANLSSCENISDIDPNLIVQAFDELYDRDVARSIARSASESR